MAAIYNYFLPINPVTERREFHLIPSCVEQFVGASSYAPQIEKSGGEITATDERYGYYVTMVKEIGSELAALAKREDLKFEFTVIDSKDDNAWCLPGGKIGINAGLIRKMELDKSSSFNLREKIAAVLSHEIVHADARHTGRSLEFRLLLIGIIKATQMFVVYHWVEKSYNAKIEEARVKNENSRIQPLETERDSQAERIGSLFDMTSSWLMGGISLCNSRSHELESDRFGMRMIRDFSKSKLYGFKQDSPQAAIWLQQFFKKHHSHDTSNYYLNWFINLFSSHPSPEERLQANRQTWQDLQDGKL
jgi:predicted Zn-dependent protease